MAGKDRGTTVAFPKPTKGSARKDQRARRRQLEADDRAETLKVLARCKDRCEFRSVFGDHLEEVCEMRACVVHHCIGGNGQRARGDSALAVNKLALCIVCHEKAHSGMYRAVGANGGPWWFERVRKG